MSLCKISPRLSHPLLVCVHRALDVKLEVPAYEQSQQMLIHRAERQQYQHQVLSGSLVGGGDASLEGKRAEVTRTHSQYSLTVNGGGGGEGCGSGRGFSSSSSSSSSSSLDCPRMNE